MKLYTKKGDGGQTQLLGGATVAKTHPRIIAYGTVDEASAALSLAQLYLDETHQQEVAEVLRLLFHCGYDLSLTDANHPFKIGHEQIAWLEAKIDEHMSKVPKTFHFVIANGTVAAAHLNLARTICRRAEREVVALAQGEQVNPLALAFLNRLSDYLFALAKTVDQGEVLL